MLQSRLMKQVSFLENYEPQRKFYLKLFERQDLMQASAVMYSMRSREYDVLQGQQVHPPPQCLHLQCILNDQGRTLLSYLLRNMSLSKQARVAGRKSTVHVFKNRGRKSILLCTR